MGHGVQAVPEYSAVLLPAPSDELQSYDGDSVDHIFERFFRVDKARSREVGGTGLGLSITKNVIQMHHGVIDVESTPGEGTTFSMRIPLNYVPRQEERL